MKWRSISSNEYTEKKPKKQASAALGGLLEPQEEGLDVAEDDVVTLVVEVRMILL